MCWHCWGVTSVTLSKIALRGARRQARDYLVYFATIVLAAALMYAFNGLFFSQEIAGLSGLLSNLPLLVGLASAAVVAIVGFLVSYVTGFLLSRRSRELGNYLLIGLEHGQVARLFFLENLAVGGAALVLGVAVGSVIYQALRAMILALFGAPYRLSLAVSPRAAGLTAAYFALIYLFALARSRRRIRRMKIADLLHLDRQNEEELLDRAGRRKWFPLSLLLGAVGTALLLTGTLALGLAGAACVIVALFAFFLSFAAGVPAYYARRPQKKYRGQTLLIFRTLTAKLNSTGAVMAILSLLFTATLIAEGSGLTFSALFQVRRDKAAAFDLYLSTTSEMHLDVYQDYLDDNLDVTGQRRYPVYWGENAAFADYLAAHADYTPYGQADQVMALSDYAALRQLKGWPAVTLEEGEYLIHCQDYLADALKKGDLPLTLAGQKMQLRAVETGALNQNLDRTNGHGFILVVSDALARTLPVSHTALAVQTAQPVSQEQYAALCAIRDGQSGSYDIIYSRADQYDQAAANSAMLVFPLYYLALVLTMTAATILTIGQLSQSGRYRRQFGLLRQLGMDEGEQKRALRRQLALYYAMPALPPLLIAVPFLWDLGGAVEPGVMTGLAHPAVITALSLGLFFAVYLLYILLAYTSLRRSVLEG